MGLLDLVGDDALDLVAIRHLEHDRRHGRVHVPELMFDVEVIDDVPGVDDRLICDGPDEDGNYLFLTCGKLNSMGSCKIDQLTLVEFDLHSLTQRLVDVLDAMWRQYTPTNDACYNAARDVLNRAEEAGIRPPEGGADLDSFDNRPSNRFGVPSDEAM